MKRIFLACVMAGCLGAFWTFAVGQDNTPDSTKRTDASKLPDKKPTATKKRKPSHWMEKKMRLSQTAFEGIAKEDFDQIAESAREMKVLSRAEHFVRSKPDSYRVQLKLFRFANDELMAAAKEGSIESATLAFNQLTVSCVNCHKLIRK